MELTGADFSNTFLALGTALADAIDRCCDLSTMNLDADYLLRECCDLEELREAYQPTDVERLVLLCFHCRYQASARLVMQWFRKVSCTKDLFFVGSKRLDVFMK